MRIHIRVYRIFIAHTIKNLDVINKVHRGMKCKKAHTLELPEVGASVETH